MTDRHGNDRWERVKSVFAEAVELDGSARTAFLERIGADDSGLRREVASLLAGHERQDLLVAPTLIDGERATRPPAPTAAREAHPMPAAIGRYRVLSLLGKGGMGEVYLARDGQLERDVALKLLPADLSREPDRRARFLHEARAAASLNHPNITTIHEIGEADGRDYLALECVRGRTLHELLAERPLSLLELVDIALPLADALAYAHERGVIHRDVKAANVMVSERGLPKLLDFGLAKLRLEAPPDPGASTTWADDVRTPRTTTLTGTVCGTPGAMSPEQALGEPLDERSDVFSFGSLLYEMACRRPPFSGRTALATMNAVIHREPEPLTERRPDLPPELLAIVARAMSKQPVDRYPRMADMAADLRQFKRQTESGLLPPARRDAPARRPVLLALATVLCAALGWTSWSAWGSSPPEDLGPTRAPSSSSSSSSLSLMPTPSAAELGGLALTASTDSGSGAGNGAPSPTSFTDSHSDSGSSALNAAPPPLAAVMHFDNLNDAEDSDQLSAMLAMLLTTNLSSVRGLQMLSQQRLFEVARKAGSLDGRIDRENATEVATRARVRTMILGQIGSVGGRLVATAEAVDVESGRALGTARAQGDDARDLFHMAESLSDQVRVLLDAPAASIEERRVLTRQITMSVDAWHAYVIGEQALRDNRVEDALEAFHRAVGLDPGFALAQYSLAIALTWLGRFEETNQAIERALAFRDRLPDALRELLDATRPYLLDNDTRTCVPYLLEVVGKDPHQRDALYMLGECYTHSASVADSAKAADVYAQMLDADPGFWLIYEHALSAQLRLGRFDQARELLLGWRENDAHRTAEMCGELALWDGRFADARDVLGDRLEVAVLARDESSAAVAQFLASSADEIVASLSDSHGVYLVLELDLRADVLVYHGRFDDAAELYRRAAAVEGTVSPDGFHTNVRNGSRHRLALLLAERGDLAGARALADEALRLQPDSPRCLYLSTRIALRQGDLEAAHAQVALLDELLGRGWGPAASFYQQAATAELELAEGHAAQARDRLAPLLRDRRQMDDWYAHEDSAGPLLRESLVRANLELGDVAAATVALDGLLGAGFERLRHPVDWVRALYLRGCLELDAGRRESGRAILEQFLTCWSDDELPEVASARARLAH